MGYLSDGDTVSITVDSSAADWQAREEQVRRQLEERYGERIVIQLGSAAQQTEGSAQQAQSSTQQTQEQTHAAQTGRWSSRSRPRRRRRGGRHRQRRQRL